MDLEEGEIEDMEILESDIEDFCRVKKVKQVNHKIEDEQHPT